jgi:hypothetical protein
MPWLRASSLGLAGSVAMFHEAPRGARPEATATQTEGCRRRDLHAEAQEKLPWMREGSVARSKA